MNRKRTMFIAAFFFLGIAAYLGGQLYYGLHKDYYWSPKQYSVTPSEALNRVELYVDGVQVRKDQNIKLRFNNKEKIMRNYLAVITFCLGVSITLFFIGLFGNKLKVLTDKYD